MALIVCPYCGEQVSDKAERCVHCGNVLNELKPKQYSNLPSNEQDSLKKEFESKYPQYSCNGLTEKADKLHKRNSIMSIFTLGCLVVFFTLVATKFVSKAVDEENYVIVIGVFIFMGVYISLLVIQINSRKKEKEFRRKVFLWKKLFQAWLLKKNIHYKIRLNKVEQKYRKIFNEINPEMYLVEEKNGNHSLS